MKFDGPTLRHLKALVTEVSSPCAESRTPAVATSATPAASKRDRCIRFLRGIGRRGAGVETDPRPVSTIALRPGRGECWRQAGWTGGRVDGWTVDGWTGGRVDGWTGGRVEA